MGSMRKVKGGTSEETEEAILEITGLQRFSGSNSQDKICQVAPIEVLERANLVIW